MEVTIRPLKEEDAYTSVIWRNDPEVFKYTGNTYDHEITIESELDWIKRVIAKDDDYRCAIEVDGEYVGNIYLTDISNQSAEYQIFLGNRKYWGMGVAKKSSELIIDYGFNILKLSEIYLEVNALNTAAIYLYNRIGFKELSREGNWIRMIYK